MAQSAQSAVLEDDLSDSDRPLLEALQSRKKDRLARENIDEDTARLQGIPRSHGRRYFGTVKPLKVPPQGNISIEAPRPSTRGRRKAGRPPRAKGIPVATNDAPHWGLVKASYSNVKPRVQESDLDISAASFADTPSCKPRIWASDQTELFEILPAISKPVGGVSWESSDIPCLILEGPTWPGDCWLTKLSFEMSMVRDFSCDESHFESPLIKIESLDTAGPHDLEFGAENSASFYDKHGSFQAPVTLVDRTWCNKPFDLCCDCPFIDSAGYYTDLAAMNVLSPTTGDVNGISAMPAPPSPAEIVASMAQCNCSRSRFLRGCKICGDGDVDAPTPSTTIVSVVQSMRRELPHSSITGLSHRDSLDAVDRSADIHCRDEAHDELTFAYPSDDEADLSSLLATYQRNKQYRMSSLRTDLSQPVDPDLCSQLTNSAPQSTNIDNLKWPNPLPKSRCNQDETVDRRIPKLIPTEIQSLIDAHTAGVPIIIIASRDCALSPVPLPPEYRYCYLGLFFLTDIHTERIESPMASNRAKGQVTGRVKWKLRFHWTPGGEDLLPDGQNLISPWWTSIPRRGEDNRRTPATTYMDRKDLQNYCHNLLPLDVLAELGPHTSGVPRGWYCVDCGKLNKQIFLRHRSCSSSSCQSNTANPQRAVGYAVRLEFAREHFQALPSVAPGNLVPKSVSKTVSAWADGMHTYCYAINDNVAVKHVFTSNRRNLQEEATSLFREIQLHVELRRQAKGPGYFTHLVGPGHGTGSSAIRWEDAPSCLRQGRDLTLHQGRTYGETEGCSVDQLTTMAWVTPGQGKGPVFHAMQGVVTILCLGADAVLSLVPKSGFAAQEVCESCLPDASSDVEMTLIDPSFNAGKVEASIDSIPQVASKGMKASKKKNAAAVTLVHGDVLVLIGDDFEAHIKRTGTTILLIGTTVSDGV